MSRDFGGGTAKRLTGDDARTLELDAQAGLEFEGIPWCWHCSKIYGHRYAVESVLVHPAYEVSGVTVQVSCHGKTAHIRIKNISWPPVTQMEQMAVSRIPFFTPHPEHELDFTGVKLKVLALAKAAYLEEVKAEAEYNRIRDIIRPH